MWLVRPGVDDIIFAAMHRYLLVGGVTISFILCFGAGLSVEAQTVLGATARRVDTRVSTNRFQSSVGVYTSANINATTGKGTLTVSRTDPDRGAILTSFSITPQTKFLKKYGGFVAFKDIRVGEELSIYSQRNPDGSQTAIEITDNNLWLLDEAIPKGQVTAIDAGLNSMTVMSATTGTTAIVSYGNDTLFQKPKGLPGTETDVVVGKNVRVRGLMRKVGQTITIEKALVVWILPAPGQTP
jgi:hypothetical protein